MRAVWFVLFIVIFVTCGAGSERKKPDIVLLVLDEFALPSLLDRAGNINAKRFPNFYKLSQEAHWFKNATTVADDTITVTPAIVTGRIPKKKTHVYRKPHYKSHPKSIFTLLQASHELRSWETSV